MKVAFYCKKHEDMDLEAEKHSNPFVEWFQANCPTCQIKLIRYISDKEKDPYYWESKKVRRERDIYAKDLIQYGQTGFRTFYKKQWDEFEKTKENYEQEQIRKKKERDEFYKKHYNERSIVKKVLEIEEQWQTNQ